MYTYVTYVYYILQCFWRPDSLLIDIVILHSIDRETWAKSSGFRPNSITASRRCSIFKPFKSMQQEGCVNYHSSAFSPEVLYSKTLTKNAWEQYLQVRNSRCFTQNTTNLSFSLVHESVSTHLKVYSSNWIISPKYYISNKYIYIYIL